MTAQVTRPAFADKIPPQMPTLAELADKVRQASVDCDRAMQRGSEYAAEENTAMNASERFWSALEMETGLTRELMGEML